MDNLKSRKNWRAKDWLATPYKCKRQNVYAIMDKMYV